MEHILSDESDSDDEMLMNVALRTRRLRNIRPRVNHFERWNDNEFVTRFRLTKLTVTFLLGLIEHELITSTNRSLSPMNQLLMTLRFYALGTMLIAVGDFAGVHKSTASVVIKRVSLAIARLLPRFVYFPRTPEETSEINRGFYEMNRFPRVLGAIDCTHVRIQSPGGQQGEVYRNRKGWFSINVQTVCDYKMRIMDVVVRWPGSAHDQHIFNNSRIQARLEMGEFGECVLLGDSGYTLKSYMITPIRHAQQPAEQLFNEAQVRTRSTVERQYGIWKRRFPVLSLGIRLAPTTTQDVISACAVIHNIAIDRNEPEPPHDPQLPQMDIFVDQIHVPVLAAMDGREHTAVQRAIVEYFNQLL